VNPAGRDIFVCPLCRGGLNPETARLKCTECNSVFVVREGIPCFVPEDRFYEGKFTAPTQDGVGASTGARRRVETFYDRWSSTRVKHHFTRSFLQQFGPGTLILDVGCGGGNRVLAPWRTVGIDLSFAGLTSAKDIYEAAATADSTALPFPDDTFDVINSWDVMGHIPPEQKDAVLAEWKRVTKPGCWMLHIIEANCTAPFYRLVRRDPGLFDKYFIDLDGHYGLELPSQIEARFRAAGFDVVRNWPFFRAGIFPPEEYAKRLGPEYQDQSRLLRWLALFGNACQRNKQLDQAMSLVTGMLARALNPLLPPEWGSTVFLIVRG